MMSAIDPAPSSTPNTAAEHRAEYSDFGFSDLRFSDLGFSDLRLSDLGVS